MFWLIFTDIIVGLSLVTLGLFAILALYQWVKRKSFRQIDPELRWALVPLALMGLTYFIFEKIFVLSYRPNGSGEPSFPSTHTMITATIFFITIIILPKYLKSRRLCLILDILMLVSVVLIAIGRVIANMHWPTDVIGGILFAALFAVIYALILRQVRPVTPTSLASQPSSTTLPSSTSPATSSTTSPRPSKSAKSSQSIKSTKPRRPHA